MTASASMFVWFLVLREFCFLSLRGAGAESETGIYPQNNWLSMSNTCAGFNEGFI